MEIILLAVRNKVLAFPFFCKFLLFMHIPYMRYCLSSFWFRRQEIISIHFRISATFQRCYPTKECLSITGISVNFSVSILQSTPHVEELLSDSVVVVIRRSYSSFRAVIVSHEVDVSDRSVPPKQSRKPMR